MYKFQQNQPQLSNHANLPNIQKGIQKQNVQKTKLTKKAYVNGFRLVDLAWLRVGDGKNKYSILVKYVDPEIQASKRIDGSYQKIIKFGQKGVQDYVDPPFSEQVRNKNINRYKTNLDNPLHPNFYCINILNGNSKDVQQNFLELKKKIFQ